jgi:hypothetical protein
LTTATKTATTILSRLYLYFPSQTQLYFALLSALYGPVSIKATQRWNSSMSEALNP